MGSSVDIFDTSGPAAAGPPPHVHPWEEVYVVLSGELEVTVEGETRTHSAGGVAHVPANVKHGYRNVTEAHFLTIVTKGKPRAFDQPKSGGGGGFAAGTGGGADGLVPQFCAMLSVLCLGRSPRGC